jgi:predicted murein hydrolase (TIGR00659 family)
MQMNDATRLYEVWVYLQAEPLFWLTLTIGCYVFADYIYRLANVFPLLNPVAISVGLVSGCLVFFDIEYERYFNGAKFIHFILGPATVALAVPIYINWKTVTAESVAILTTVFVGSIFAVVITFALAVLFGIDLLTIKSMLPRSVTAPIAMGISELIGGVPSLTAIITVVTGVTGAALGAFVLDPVRIKNMAARGFAFGLSSHGIGTARAMSRDKTAGVFAAVAMGLSGVITALLLPMIFRLINDLL